VDDATPSTFMVAPPVDSPPVVPEARADAAPEPAFAPRVLFFSLALATVVLALRLVLAP
jgi:hypothetical protein